MKKFFTVVPLQAPNAPTFKPYHYECVGNTKLQMDGETKFPIVTAINGYADEGEEIRVIAVVQDHDNPRENLKTLKSEVEGLCHQKGFCLPENDVEEVVIPYNQELSTYIDIFQTLINYTEDNDELFVCMTYGTKPISTAVTLAAQYAYRIRNNVSITCIVYGEIIRDLKNNPVGAKVYDMTALVQLDEIVHILADRKVEKPEEALKALLEV